MRDDVCQSFHFEMEGDNNDDKMIGKENMKY